MSERAPVLVYGATGFTGHLVCAALAARGVAFAAGGRDRAKLDGLASRFGCETAAADVRDAESLVAAIDGRKVVLACAGPFMAVGEPVLATAARSGVHYADTTGEQRFVADMVARYRATAEARKVCIAPSFAYEVAVGDWVAHEAALALGSAPESLEVTYANKPSSSGGYGASTTRGTKLSAFRMMAEERPLQFVDGSLQVEPVANKVLTVFTSSGRALTAISFPSPESVLTPAHTRATTLRTFMVMGRAMARGAHVGRAALPALGRTLLKVATPFVEKMSAGPEGEARVMHFEVIATARAGGREATVRAAGSDPYGLTAEIQALFATRVLEGKVTATGIVGASEVIAPADAFAALQSTGLRRLA